MQHIKLFYSVQGENNSLSFPHTHQNFAVFPGAFQLNLEDKSEDKGDDKQMKLWTWHDWIYSSVYTGTGILSSLFDNL